MNKVVIAGGTGFIGNYLCDKFSRDGCDVRIISRREPYVSWQNREAIVDALEGADLLINLAGKSVNCRYHEQNKREIMRSRTETTSILGEAVQACTRPPRVWMNSSTATIYRHAEDRPMTETDGEIGSGFSVDVAVKWEEAFFAFELPDTRQIALRIAIVLGKEGAFVPIRTLARFGLGGRQGSGKQMFSWIHIEDLYRVICFLAERDDLAGVFNVSAPTPVTNETFMRSLRKRLGMKIGLPSPRWLLELGAVLIRTETELVLKSRWVVPERLRQQGFEFQYDTIDKAISELVNHR